MRSKDVCNVLRIYNINMQIQEDKALSRNVYMASGGIIVTES